MIDYTNNKQSKIKDKFKHIKLFNSEIPKENFKKHNIIKQNITNRYSFSTNKVNYDSNNLVKKNLLPAIDKNLIKSNYGSNKDKLNIILDDPNSRILNKYITSPKLKHNNYFEIVSLSEPSLPTTIQNSSPLNNQLRESLKKITDEKMKTTKKFDLNDRRRSIKDNLPKDRNLERIDECIFLEDKSNFPLPYNLNSKFNSVFNKLVNSYSYKEDQNFKFKKKMEDFHNIYQKSDNEILFTLYDGHGGDKVAKYAKEHFIDIFFSSLSKLGNNVEKTFDESIFKLENELIFPKAREMGTTLSIVYICKQNSKKYLYCANVGDSRCILISKDRVNRISYDHKCDDKQEIERIKQAGGFVQNGRLMGIINLSRSIGDIELKQYGLISNPNFFKIELTKNDKFVIMASDGVWDVINDFEAYKISQNIDDSDELAYEIVNKSIEYGSKDNISCITIKL